MTYHKSERKNWRKILRQTLIGTLILFLTIQLPPIRISPAKAEPTTLMVFAEAPSFGRLDDVDPSGWFYQAVLYNPTNTSIVLNGLRWRYNATAKFIEASRNARCYDKRYFTALPTTSFLNDHAIYWEYTAGSISITVPPKKVIVTWIEVPARSINDETISTFYYVEAHVGTQWLSSPTYPSHSGQDNAATTLFRADFNLTTSPTSENQTHPNPEWFFNEDRYVIANTSTRVRLIPVTASRNSLGIDTATINITLPTNWRYVSSSTYNPYGETMTPYTIAGKDKLKWDLTNAVTRYATNQSMNQNYIEFNITAPYAPGIYNFTVNARITSLAAKTTTENQNIQVVVKTPPTAVFTSSPKPALTLQSVRFNASNSLDLDGQIMNYLWDFGDGMNATGKTTSHTYTDNANYTVELIITDDDGLKSSTQEVINILNRPPTAQFTESAEIVDTDVIIHFNASLSYDLDGSITGYFWDFGDGTNTTSMTTNHSYQDNGNYTVSLTVTDDDGATDSTNSSKTVHNKPPAASFIKSPETAYTAQSTAFNASDSYDPDGTIMEYFWDFGDGINATGIIVNHAYTENGTYTVTLTVTDNDGAATSINATMTVLNRAPIASFTESATTVYTGQTIYFNATRSYDLDGYITDYIWDFGDNANATGLTVSHAYAEQGFYTVKLTVRDNDEASNTTVEIKTILNRAPVASFAALPSQPIVGMLITFNASSSYDPDGTIVNYTWSFGDGNLTVTSENVVTHVYSTASSFNVTLTVVDNDSKNTSTSQLIAVHVHNVVVINVTISTSEVQVGETVTIRVSVKNEGTTAESFNVSVFCNETEVATQPVPNLFPSAERILVFNWSTSSVPDTAKFLIQAKASVVPYENNVTDNTYTGGFVNVLKVSDNGFSLWPPSGWGWLLFTLPLLVLFIVGITWKRRSNSESSRGIKFLDELTDGPIPDGFSVLISGEAGSGKSILCQELTYNYLEMEKPCVYVTYDCFPNEIRENIQRFHGTLSEYESKGKFVFIDCFSSIAKVESKEKYSVSQPFSLSDLGITMSQVMDEGNSALRVFLDSAVPLLTHVDPLKVVEFLQDRSARVKGVNGTFIFTVGKETIEPSLISRLQEVVDCVIEIDASMGKGRTVRRLRVKKMRGRRPSEKWVRFEIDPRRGIMFLA
jgi:PKD repeat protein/KaiC/GvpD/RAD55 family RecA-like ATPase